MTLPELLAPAGSFAALHAAVRAGADAVYLGMSAFNARRNAENFDSGNIRQACDYAHLRGAKVYITMNTIVLPEEMSEALDCAICAYDGGADAFIVQDIGLISALQREIPDIELHASTQMNIHSASGIEAVAALGLKRVTLARELSVEEIAHLTRTAAELGLQVETFAHGALCVCYSGQCLMSSMIGGRSANRGLCAQACRLNYELECDDGKRKETPGDFLLSPKDLCSIDLLDQLIDAGVASLKIEGRMKSPEYVQSVVSVYRDVLDRIEAANMAPGGASAAGSGASIACDAVPKSSAEPTKDERNKLSSAFSRGFTTAYLEGRRGNEVMSYQRPNNRGQFVGRIKWVRDGKAGIACEQQLVPGDLIEVWTKRGRSALSVGEGANCSASFAEVPLGEKDKVYVSDRVFRVRSAEAAFKDCEGEPRIPIVGSVRLELGKPLQAAFHLADEGDLYDGPDAAVQRRILKRLEHAPESHNRTVQPASAWGSAEGAIVESARSKEVSAEDVRAHIDRLGTTPFKLERLSVSLDEGVGIGFSQLHHVRAEALDALQEALLAPYRTRNRIQQRSTIAGESDDSHECTAEMRSIAEKSQGAEIDRRVKHTKSGRSIERIDSHAAEAAEIVALATNPECAHAAKRAGAAHIYVPALNYKRGMAEIQGCAILRAGQTSYPKHSTIVMPVVCHDAEGLSREARTGIDPWENVKPDSCLMVQGIGDMQRAAQMGACFEIGAHIPLVNHDAMGVAHALNAQRVWLSPELNLHQIADLAHTSAIPLGMRIFGAQELMTTEHCILASQGPCNEDCAVCVRRTKLHRLKDRKGYGFPVTSDALGRGHIYNSVKLDATPELSQLIEAGVTRFMVDTTLMSVEESAQAVGYCVHALQVARSHGANGADSMPKRMSGSTSGHLHRGVL